MDLLIRPVRHMISHQRILMMLAFAVLMAAVIVIIIITTTTTTATVVAATAASAVLLSLSLPHGTLFSRVTYPRIRACNRDIRQTRSPETTSAMLA